MSFARNLTAYLFAGYLLFASPSDAKLHITHEFTPKETKPVAIVANTTDSASNLIRRAEKYYGKKNIEFAINGTYFAKGKSVGRIVNNGRQITNGISKHGGAFIYDDSFHGMLDIVDADKIQYTPEFMQDGLVPLIPEYSMSGRRIDQRPRMRQIIGIKKDGNGVIIYETTTPKGARDIAERYNFVEAAMGDGGSSALLYKKGHYALKPARKLKSIIVGVKKYSKRSEEKIDSSPS